MDRVTLTPKSVSREEGVTPNSDSYRYVNIKTCCGGRFSTFLLKRPSKEVESDLADIVAGPVPGSDEHFVESLKSTLKNFSFVDETITEVTSRKKSEARSFPYWIGIFMFVVAWFVSVLAAITAASTMFTVWWWATRLPTDTKTPRKRKQQPKQSETAEWLNIFFKTWWTNLSPTLYTIVKEKLDPQLKKNKSSYIKSLKLRRFILGDRPLFRSLENVKVIQFPSVLTSETILQADLCVESESFRTVLRVQPWPFNNDVDFVAENLEFRCKVRAVFAIDRQAPAPHVACVNLALTEAPQVWFTANVDMNILGIPINFSVKPFGDWMKKQVVDKLVPILIHPAKINIFVSKASKV